MLRRLAAAIARHRTRRPPTAGQLAAAEALRRVEQEREASLGRRGEVVAAAAALRQHRSDNHFAERIRLTLQEGR